MILFWITPEKGMWIVNQKGCHNMSTTTSGALLLLVVDEMALSRAQLSVFLREFAHTHSMRLKSVGVAGAGATAQDNDQEGLCIVNAGKSSDEGMLLSMVRRLHEARKSRPVVLFIESAHADFVGRALAAGARGVIPACTEPEIALRSLEFTLRGGIYIPPSILDDLKLIPAPSRDEKPSAEKTVAERDVLPAGTPNGPARTCAIRPADIVERPVIDGVQDGGLTQRQSLVLVHLREGRSNKEIARLLDTTEGTVKVHVRQIMRKLGAKN